MARADMTPLDCPFVANIEKSNDMKPLILQHYDCFTARLVGAYIRVTEYLAYNKQS
jgi:hypothetical protein